MSFHQPLADNRPHEQTEAEAVAMETAIYNSPYNVARRRAAAKLEATIHVPSPTLIAYLDPCSESRKKAIILSAMDDTVEFRPQGNTVKVITKSNYGRRNSRCTRVTMPVEMARLEYKRLLQDGYLPW